MSVKSNCQYYYFNLKVVLTNHILNNKIKNLISIPLNLNIDGLPLFKNSNASVWPILLSINSKIYPIALTYGRKPTNLDFLIDIVNDLKKY